MTDNPTGVQQQQQNSYPGCTTGRCNGGSIQFLKSGILKRFPSISLVRVFYCGLPPRHTPPSGCLLGTARIISSQFNFSSLIFSTRIQELISLLSLSCIAYEKSIIRAKGWKTMTHKLHVCPLGQEERIHFASITLRMERDGVVPKGKTKILLLEESEREIIFVYIEYNRDCAVCFKPSIAS